MQTGSAQHSQPQLLPNPNGLHARPAAVLAQAAKGFAATIQLHKQGESANAKSLVAIMALQTVCGDSVHLSATGPDAGQALKVLGELLASSAELRRLWQHEDETDADDVLVSEPMR